MAFKHRSGKPALEWYPVATSQTFTNGDLAYMNGSGGLIPGDSTSGDHFGVIAKTIAATDADYASARKVPVYPLRPDDIFEADVVGTLTAAMVGNQYDLSDAGTVNVAAQAKKVVTCVGFISATKGLFKINASVFNDHVATT